MMDDEKKKLPILENLSTGKPHISFSEIREWKDCSYRHYLSKIKGVGVNKPGVHMDFGTSIHSACEHYLKTRSIDVDIFINKLDELWKKGVEWEVLNKIEQKTIQYSEKSFEQFKAQGLAILVEFPEWFNTQFKDWEFIDVEHSLYERLEKHPSQAFKGFIDCIISVPDKKKDKKTYWIIDF
jgi:hypothetical protein